MHRPLHFLFQPVRFAPLSPGDDPGDALPYGWCPECGREIFAPQAKLCKKCRQLFAKDTKEDTNGEISK